MTALTKASLSSLHRRAEKALDLLALENPTVVQELRLILSLIRQREQSTGVDFAGIRSPRKAVELCLAENGGPMTKQAIVDRLVDGGYIRNVDTEKWLVNDAINFGLKKNYFITQDDSLKLETVIALPFQTFPS